MLIERRVELRLLRHGLSARTRRLLVGGAKFLVLRFVTSAVLPRSAPVNLSTSMLRGWGTCVAEAHTRGARPCVTKGFTRSPLERSSAASSSVQPVSSEIGLLEPVFGPAEGQQTWPAIASNGNSFLAVWASPDLVGAPTRIRGMRLGLDGSLQDKIAFFVANSNAYPGPAPAVASNGQGYLVSYVTGDGLYAQLVAADGTVDPSAIAISPGPGRVTPAVVSNGTDYFVVWGVDDTGCDEIWGECWAYGYAYGARVTATGTVLDSTPIAIDTSGTRGSAPAVAWNGTEYLTVWTPQLGSTQGVRITADGIVRDTTPFVIAESGSGTPAIASNGTDYLVTWIQGEGSSNYLDISGARISASGTRLDATPILISSILGYDPTPTAAYDGSHYVVAWDNGSGVVGRRVGSDGTVTDPADVPLTGSIQSTDPALAFVPSSGGFVVYTGQKTVTSDSDIYASRVTASFTVATADMLVSIAARAEEKPAIASNGTGYLLAWKDGYVNENIDVRGARVADNGSFLDARSIQLSSDSLDTDSEAVASNGSNYLVAWMERSIGGRLVSPDGSGQEIAISTASAGSPISVASDGNGYLVVWSKSVGTQNPNTDQDIFGRRVAGNGTVLDANDIVIAAASGTQWSPIVAWNGANYQVVWRDARNNGGAYGARVSSAGVVLDPAGVPISTFPASGMASNGNGCLVEGVSCSPSADGTPLCNILGVRIAQSGTLQDSSPIPISVYPASKASPVAASNGKDYFVAWQDQRARANSTTNVYDLYGARVTSTGEVTDTQGIVLSSTTVSELDPVLTWDRGSGQYLLAYTRYVAESPFDADAVRARLICY